ncbi:hypothetical protein [Eoetvoesiella caeni]|uniref:Uncharacterized protein n=1 Tax=Eoetvoesiella caeni TaxID=645616 RepID=A0A366H2P1_9BURK|nr:hypothetical protein [Eoetvoesiella caeni]NYT53623.1 hypothetical protein [Eoetvoesiella caeni]RBP36045.1 hypothetical protein DFR37_114100 [Eoetvoesiella caeni]
MIIKVPGGAHLKRLIARYFSCQATYKGMHRVEIVAATRVRILLEKAAKCYCRANCIPAI